METGEVPGSDASACAYPPSWLDRLFASFDIFRPALGRCIGEFVG